MTLGTDYLRRKLPVANVNFPVCLAPMVGLSHVAVRTLVRRYLPRDAVTIWPTEMLSSWRLPNEELGSTPETRRAPGETHLVPQILGNEEEPIRKSLQKLEDWGVCGVDINMGCPVKKALRHNYGVALMGDAEYAAAVVAMTVRHAKVPVSVKLRAGLQGDLAFLEKFVTGLVRAGASWLTLHPRIGSQKRRGAADWSQIRFVRDRVGVPVIGNGDVQCLDDVFAMMDVTGCDLVMVGRALVARPWLLWQVGERLGLSAPADDSLERCPWTPAEEGREYGRAALFLVDELERHFEWNAAFTRFKFYIRMTMGWLEFGHHLFSLVSRARSFDDLRAALNSFFAVEQRMCARTQLRE